MNIQNKAFLIIGASGGIGEQVTRHLNLSGANIILHSHQLNALNSSKAFTNTTCITADLSNTKGIHNFVSRIKQMHVPLSGIIFAAGMNEFKWLENQEDDTIEKLLFLNLHAPILLTKHLLPLMDPQNNSTLVYIGSTMGSIGLPGSSTYCASKFGIRGFTQALRRELIHSKIYCQYIAPRATKTQMNSQKIVDLNYTLNYKMDDPEWVAAKIIQAIESNANETYLGWPERFLVKLNGLLPGFVDKFLAKQVHIFKKYANL